MRFFLYTSNQKEDFQKKTWVARRTKKKSYLKTKHLIKKMFLLHQKKIGFKILKKD